jgi:plastocyanin domain-containing protein
MKNKRVTILTFALVLLLIGSGVSEGFAGHQSKKGLKKARITAFSHPKTVKVTVNGEGFNPSTIKVEKGHPLSLVFYRVERDGCGAEVVFPALNIRRTLPLKRNVTVKFTPKESGEIAFSCGMNMMKGKIVAN